MTQAYRFQLGLISLLLIMSIPLTGSALLPEPSVIIYGQFEDGKQTVTAKIGGEVMASYTLGDNSGDAFILMIPLDAVDPHTAGTGRVGDLVDLYDDDSATPSQTGLLLEERGSVIDLYPETPTGSYNDLLWTK